MRRAALTATALVTAGAALAACGPSSGKPLSAAIGRFAPTAAQAQFLGTSVFTQDSNGVVRVQGLYRGLPASSAFFTVVYANGNCDPAQAFPVGPFYTNARGIGRIDQAVPAPAGTVAGTGSVSVRIGDTAADLDGDGKTGPTDVVAVAGTPATGLVECDSTPLVGSANVPVPNIPTSVLSQLPANPALSGLLTKLPIR